MLKYKMKHNADGGVQFVRQVEEVKEEGLTQAQVQWAMQHDWFVRTCRCQPQDNTQGFVIGALVRHDVKEAETMVFTNFEELKAWAGY